MPPSQAATGSPAEHFSFKLSAPRSSAGQQKQLKDKGSSSQRVAGTTLIQEPAQTASQAAVACKQPSAGQQRAADEPKMCQERKKDNCKPVEDGKQVRAALQPQSCAPFSEASLQTALPQTPPAAAPERLPQHQLAAAAPPLLQTSADQLLQTPSKLSWNTTSQRLKQLLSQKKLELTEKQSCKLSQQQQLMSGTEPDAQATSSVRAGAAVHGGMQQQSQLNSNTSDPAQLATQLLHSGAVGNHQADCHRVHTTQPPKSLVEQLDEPALAESKQPDDQLNRTFCSRHSEVSLGPQPHLEQAAERQMQSPSQLQMQHAHQSKLLTPGQMPATEPFSGRPVCVNSKFKTTHSAVGRKLLGLQTSYDANTAPDGTADGKIALTGKAGDSAPACGKLADGEMAVEPAPKKRRFTVEDPALEVKDNSLSHKASNDSRTDHSLKSYSSRSSSRRSCSSSIESQQHHDSSDNRKRHSRSRSYSRSRCDRHSSKDRTRGRLSRCSSRSSSAGRHRKRCRRSSRGRRKHCNGSSSRQGTHRTWCSTEIYADEHNKHQQHHHDEVNLNTRRSSSHSSKCHVTHTDHKDAAQRCQLPQPLQSASQTHRHAETGNALGVQHQEMRIAYSWGSDSAVSGQLHVRAWILATGNAGKQWRSSGLPQPSKDVLPPIVAVQNCHGIDSLSSSVWQSDLKPCWNGDLLVLVPSLSAAGGDKDADLASELDFARLASLLWASGQPMTAAVSCLGSAPGQKGSDLRTRCWLTKCRGSTDDIVDMLPQESRDKLKAMVPAMFQGGSSAGHSYILAFVTLDPQSGCGDNAAESESTVSSSSSDGSSIDTCADRQHARHSLNDPSRNGMNPVPRLPKTFKSGLCYSWIRGEICRFGLHCHFAHGQAELR